MGNRPTYCPVTVTAANFLPSDFCTGTPWPCLLYGYCPVTLLDARVRTMTISLQYNLLLQNYTILSILTNLPYAWLKWQNYRLAHWKLLILSQVYTTCNIFNQSKWTFCGAGRNIYIVTSTQMISILPRATAHCRSTINCQWIFTSLASHSSLTSNSGWSEGSRRGCISLFVTSTPKVLL